MAFFSLGALLLGLALSPSLAPTRAKVGHHPRLRPLRACSPFDDEEVRQKLGKAVEKLIESGALPSSGGPMMVSEDELNRLLAEYGDEDDDDDSQSGGGGNAASNAAASIEDFDLKPLEIFDFLNRFVIKQEEAKRVLAVACCDHYNHVRRCLADPAGYGAYEVSKPNILLVGPTGVGKTYLMRNIAKLIGVPFVTADATKFSETGVVGKDADDLVRDLVAKADGNATLAQYGIIYVDEIDKIAAPGQVGGEGGRAGGGGWNTRGVQNTFLKLLEDSEVSLANPMQSMMIGFPGAGGDSGPQRISTKNILFVFSGAFTSLDATLKKKRSKKATLGFDVGRVADAADAAGADGGGGGDEDDESASALRHATTADFVEAGLEPEFVGRVPVRVACDALSEDDLLRVLTSSEGSVLGQMRRDLDGYGLEMEHTDEALRQVARLAAAEGTGARGLVTVLERTLRGHKFALPSSSLSSFTMDNATVSDPDAALALLLASESADERLASRLSDVKRYEARLRRQLGDGVQCWLTDEAVDVCIRDALAANVSTFSLCLQRFERLPAALRHVAQHTSQTRFPINADMARDPAGEIDRWMEMAEAAST